MNVAAGAPIRRYLDNAATSWPKPPEVLAAWEHAGRAIGAAAGRGGYREDDLTPRRASQSIVRPAGFCLPLGNQAGRHGLLGGCIDAV